MFLGQSIGQIGHARTAQNNGFSAVLSDSTSDLGADAVAGVRSGEFQL